MHRTVLLLIISILSLPAFSQQQDYQQSPTSDDLLKIALPEFHELNTDTINERNLLIISIYPSDEIKVRNNPTEIHKLKNTVKEFILNPEKSPVYAESPT